MGQQYQKIIGAMIVTYDGKTRTLPEMLRRLENTDRSIRKAAWELRMQRFLENREGIDVLYDNLVRLRTRIARNAGFGSYIEYAFRARGRFDYSPRHCDQFQAAIGEVVVPALRFLGRRRRRLLGVDVLRPWDLAVDLGGPSPRPFEKAADLVEGCARMFGKVHPVFAKQFALIRKKGYLDLESREGKAPGGYQIEFDLERLPFIFANVVGRHGDVQALLHEGGHAFHSMASRGHALYFHRLHPPEFGEVASMGMELLAQPYLDEFYSREEADRVRGRYLEELLERLAWIARVDAFEHWVYTHPDARPADRCGEWADLRRRFSSGEDWVGYKDGLESEWQQVHHVFTVPMYCCAYGVAQIGALQLWWKARRNRRRVVADYRKALSLGGTRPLPDLYRAAGIDLDFGTATIRPIVGAMLRELQRLYEKHDSRAKGAGVGSQRETCPPPGHEQPEQVGRRDASDLRAEDLEAG